MKVLETITEDPATLGDENTPVGFIHGPGPQSIVSSSSLSEDLKKTPI